MSAEDFKWLTEFMEQQKRKDSLEVVKLYKHHFPQGARNGAVFAFVGPGTGAEVLAMIAFCQSQGVSKFEIVQVDRPRSINSLILGPQLPFETLIADYIAETKKVMDFFYKHSVNTVIVRNTQTTLHHISVLTTLAQYAKDVGGRGLITVRSEDYSPVLERNLVNLGMSAQEITPELSVTEQYIYTL